MAKVDFKVNAAVQECHILSLGTQVLLGFQFQSVYSKGFEKLAVSTRHLHLLSLGLMMASMALLISAVAHHQVVEEGENSESFHRFFQGIAGWALLPFAGGIGLSFYVATERFFLRSTAALIGLAAASTALFFWYGLGALHRMRRKPEHRETGRDDSERNTPQRTEMRDKIGHALEEIRTILPGVQALLGFQLVSMLAEGFEKIPRSSQLLHIGSLSLIALTIILLMTPAAYHRMDDGEDTDGFHRFTRALVLWSLLPFALGLSLDFYVVSLKVTDSVAFASLLAGLSLAMCLGLWFGFTLYRRSKERSLQWSNVPRQADKKRA